MGETDFKLKELRVQLCQSSITADSKVVSIEKMIAKNF